ncbi:hypothetical protein [Syntrophomonas wolfei]|uniref:hypothetical protein n=2 Tax=Syntrophomonas wolfei TaxID=863 RepID=UPI0023EFAE0C|nr:hypothetical protein [Syntrophomonas wolfei]
MLIIMGKVDQLFKEIEKLSLDEQQEILQRLVDKLDLLGSLLLADQVLSDWENPEDKIYDQL